jgi:putative sigma-54 modulation protein
MGDRRTTRIHRRLITVQVQVACRHGSISPDLADYVKTKSEKLLIYFERVTQIMVTFSFEGPRLRVEILVDAEHKHNFVAHCDGEDSQPTFDSAYHKMELQIKRYKEKVQDHRRDQSLAEQSLAELSRVEEADAE